MNIFNMSRFTKALKIGGIVFILNYVNLFASDNVIALKDLDNLNKTIKFDRLIDIYNGKVEVNQDPQRIYLFSNEKYYTNIVYSDQFRSLSNRNRDFFEKWFVIFLLVW